LMRFVISTNPRRPKPSLMPYRGGRFYFSVGRVQREGVELGALLRTVSGFGVNGSLTLSRNRYVRYIVDSVHYGRPGAIADYAGNRMPGVPGMYYGASLSQRIATALPLEARVGFRGIGKYFVDDANLVSVPAHNLVDLTLAVGKAIGISEGFGLRGFVEITNLINTAHIGSAFLNPDVVGGVPLAYEPGAPRTYVLSVTLSRRK